MDIQEPKLITTAQKPCLGLTMETPPSRFAALALHSGEGRCSLLASARSYLLPNTTLLRVQLDYFRNNLKKNNAATSRLILGLGFQITSILAATCAPHSI